MVRLARRFGASDALLGDLLEQHADGRSWFWLQRQILAATLIGQMATVRNHKLVAVWAIAVGWLGNIVIGHLVGMQLLPLLGGPWHVPIELWMVRHLGVPYIVPLRMVITMCVVYALTGFLVSWLSRPFSIPMLLAFLASLVSAHAVGFLFSFAVGHRMPIDALIVNQGFQVSFWVSALLGGLAASAKSGRSFVMRSGSG